MMILFNPNAGGSKAADKWRRLLATLPPFREKINTLFLTATGDLAGAVGDAIADGEKHLLAAGGDGTVNAILNAIMNLPESSRTNIVLGAAGLGSSNDFHKPFDAHRTIEGIPVRLNYQQTERRDVGRAIITRHGRPLLRYFMLNASTGITANGNALFNRPDALLGFLKRHATPLAILYAAVRAMTSYTNVEFTLRMSNTPPIRIRLVNLGIVKNPHFSGTLRYGSTPDYADGMFRIHAAEAMNLVERLRLLIALSHGRFARVPKTHSWVGSAITVSASESFTLELDGETFEAEQVEFTVVPQAIRVCS